MRQTVEAGDLGRVTAVRRRVAKLQKEYMIQSGSLWMEKSLRRTFCVLPRRRILHGRTFFACTAAECGIL